MKMLWHNLQRAVVVCVVYSCLATQRSKICSQLPSSLTQLAPLLHLHARRMSRLARLTLSPSCLFPASGPVSKFSTRQRADFVHQRWHLALPRFPLPCLTSRTLPVSSLDYLRMSASFLNDSSVWLHTARSFSQFVLSPDHHGSTTGHRGRAAGSDRSEWVQEGDKQGQRWSS
jgi:hypothetical protein